MDGARFLALTLLLAVVPVSVRAQASSTCDPDLIRREADEGRDSVAAGIDAAAARAAWSRVLDCGGAIAWPATLYSVDARSTFVFTFDRAALRVYRSQSHEPEAVVAWKDIREIAAGNWVIWFRLRQPVDIRSDRGRHKRVKELKVFLHGGDGGDLSYYYNLEYAGRHWFWGTPIYRVENLRGIAVGPTEYQRRVQGFLAMMFDPDGRIVLKRKGRGAGW